MIYRNNGYFAKVEEPTRLTNVQRFQPSVKFILSNHTIGFFDADWSGAASCRIRRLSQERIETEHTEITEHTESLSLTTGLFLSVPFSPCVPFSLFCFCCPRATANTSQTNPTRAANCLRDVSVRGCRDLRVGSALAPCLRRASSALCTFLRLA